MKNLWKYLLCGGLLIPILLGMYVINGQNYLKYRERQVQIVHHPEKLPNSKSASLASVGFTNMMADLYWLQAVQYIGENAISGEYKKYLGAMMDLITDLNPYFESPYTIGQLLLPSSTGAVDVFEGEEALKGIHEGESLGLKGVENFCDEEKIQIISREDNLSEIINNPKYSNPCKSYKVPYHLAYIYFYYLKDNLSASKYYKIVSAQTDAPNGARVLAAIMQGKGGKREKSLYMFLSLAQNIGESGEYCTQMTRELEQTYTLLHEQNIPLTGELVKNIEILSQQILPKLTEENENEILSDTECSNYLVKSVREINLMYLDAADEKYQSDHDGKSAKNPRTLLRNGYIDFIPTDYQQYEESEYGIIYTYNKDIGRFDYSSGKYGTN